MTTPRWALLDRLQETAPGPDAVTPQLLTALAVRLEEALSDRSKASLNTLKTQLADLFKALLRRSPEDAAKAAVGTEALPATQAAYRLGQISFAQLLAAQTAQGRADDTTLDALRASTFRPYLAALFQGELTGQGLAAATGERVETVSRKLRTLRDLGLVDSRRDGVNIYNVLTPLARSAIEGLGGVPEPAGGPADVSRRAAAEREKLEPHMQSLQVMSSEPRSFLARG